MGELACEDPFQEASYCGRMDLNQLRLRARAFRSWPTKDFLVQKNWNGILTKEQVSNIP